MKLGTKTKSSSPLLKLDKMKVMDNKMDKIVSDKKIKSIKDYFESLKTPRNFLNLEILLKEKYTLLKKKYL